MPVKVSKKQITEAKKNTKYNPEFFTQADRAQIRADFEGGARTITLHGIVFTMHLQTRNVTWFTGARTPSKGHHTSPADARHQVERWIIVSPADKKQLVPMCTVGYRSNLRSKIG